MRALQKPVSTALLSGVLVAASLLWFCSLWAFMGCDTRGKDPFSAAPLIVMLGLVIVPMCSIILIPWVILAHRTKRRRLGVFDWFALLVGTAPLLILGAWLVLAFLGAVAWGAF